MDTPKFALLISAWSMVRSPAALAVFSMGLGFSLLLWGVYLLLGPGATLLIGSIPPLFFGCALAKGLTRGE